LCLQWEPEIIAIAVLYLACKLSKFEITDWTTKKENNKQKWWEQFVEGLTKDIIEGWYWKIRLKSKKKDELLHLDICHQHLDLYAKSNLSAPGNGSVGNPSIMLTPTQTNSTITSPIQPISIESPSTSRSIPSAKRVNQFE
jgi:hypothetical protein